MAEKVVSLSSNEDGYDRKREPFTILDKSTARVTYLAFYSLPENLRHIVADYISDDTRCLTRRVLLEKPQITLCLSQYANLELGSCWHFGCLSPDDRWESSMEVKVDKQFLFKDHENCLLFLDSVNSDYCPIFVKVLIIQLDLSSQDLASALDNLQTTLANLQEHLSNVQHVVFALEKYAFCCFSLKHFIGNAIGPSQPIVRPLALKQILDDLRTCLATNQSLSTKLLLDHYILSDVKPESDMYLSKFVISINHVHGEELFGAVDPTINFSKLRWILAIETADDMRLVDQRMISRCHAFHLDASITGVGYWICNLKPVFGFQDNPCIERISIDSEYNRLAIHLPRPPFPLFDSTIHSALIELTLKGKFNTVHLTDLNNGYFKQLSHLSIIGGTITGRLDSCYLPHLKTLRIEPGRSWNRSSPSKRRSRIQECAQSVLRSGLSWQLVASQDPGGWSLASYVEIPTNPQEDVKEDAPSSISPHSLRLTKELLLVMHSQANAVEFQSNLNGDPALDAAVGDQNVPLLVWAPESVQKIIAFGVLKKSTIQFPFNQTMVGQKRILDSLTCHNFDVVLDGATFPHLQSFEINDGMAALSGAFKILTKLSLQKATIRYKWQVNAPLLETLDCRDLEDGNNLSLRPLLLPHLSVLQITRLKSSSPDFPEILVNEDSVGLSRVKHVMVDERMSFTPFFNQCQVTSVSNLELTLSATKLPASWHDTVWLCETLKMDVYGHLVVEKKIGLPELPRVKKLTLTVNGIQVVLNREMPQLTECTVPSLKHLGLKFKCPKLERICFTEKLSDSDKKMCLNPGMYEVFDANPSEVYFAHDDQIHTMSWCEWDYLSETFV